MTDPIVRINDLRQKVISGEELTREEAREAIELLRSARSSSTEKKVAKEKAKGIASSDFDLGSLFDKGKDDGKNT